jgi:hypothetical protein
MQCHPQLLHKANHVCQSLFSEMRRLTADHVRPRDCRTPGDPDMILPWPGARHLIEKWPPTPL